MIKHVLAYLQTHCLSPFRSRLLWLCFFLTTGQQVAHAQTSQPQTYQPLGVVGAFFYQVFGLLGLAALICLIMGIKKPESFRSLFKEHTSKKVVGWSFGALLLFCGSMLSVFEPKPLVTPAEQAAKVALIQAEEKERLAEASAKEAEAKAIEAKVTAELAKPLPKAPHRARPSVSKTPVKPAVEQGNPSSESELPILELNEMEEESTATPTQGPKVTWGILDINPKFQLGSEIMTIVNKDEFAWDDVQVILNPIFGFSGGYRVRLQSIAPSEKVFIPYKDMANARGDRFDITRTKALSVAIRCKTRFGTGTRQGTFTNPR
jgi:hypothetical protein